MTTMLKTFDCQQCGASHNIGSNKYNYCPQCGQPSSDLMLSRIDIFSRLPVSHLLKDAVRQYGKYEVEASARTAIIILEEEIRRFTGLDLVGAELIGASFSYKMDLDGNIVVPPLLKINNLKTDSEKNEHDGIKLLFLGLFRGIRNLLAHKNAKIHPRDAFGIIVFTSTAIGIVLEGGIANERHCIWTKVG